MLSVPQVPGHAIIDYQKAENFAQYIILFDPVQN